MIRPSPDSHNVESDAAPKLFFVKVYEYEFPFTESWQHTVSLVSGVNPLNDTEYQYATDVVAPRDNDTIGFTVGPG